MRRRVGSIFTGFTGAAAGRGLTPLGVPVAAAFASSRAAMVLLLRLRHCFRQLSGPGNGEGVLLTESQKPCCNCLCGGG
jgi:hypothetical protein